MQYVALVTLLLLLQYLTFTMLVGNARGKSGVAAPAVSGDQIFERAYRIQMNTLEQLAMTIPALWISGYYFRPDVAAGLGLLFFIGRLLYRAAYLKDPASRGPGMIVGFVGTLGLLLTASWGVIGAL